MLLQQRLPLAEQDSEHASELRSVSAEEFRHQLKEHQLWLDSAGREGKRGNFRNADLTQVDFTGANLAEASLRGARLAGADVSSADFRSADLAEADLDGTNFSGGVLTGANFARASLRGANLRGSDLAGAVFSDAVLESADFTGARLPKANLRQANLARAIFKDANLAEATLREAQLNEAVLEKAQLREADCRAARFSAARFSGAFLTNTQFKGADLSGVDFSQADFSLALDIAPEFQAQSFLDEQKKLEEERARLRDMAAEIAAERQQIDELSRRLDGQKEALIRLDRGHSEFLGKYEYYRQWFGRMGAIWFLVTLLFAFFVGSIVSHIDFGRLKLVEIAIASSAAALVLILVMVTAWRAMQVSGLMNEQKKKYAQTLAAIEGGDSPAAGAASLPASGTALDRLRAQSRSHYKS